MTCLIVCYNELIRSVHSVFVLGCLVDSPAMLFCLHDAPFSHHWLASPAVLDTCAVTVCQRGRVKN